MASNNPEQYEELQQMLSEIVPEVERVRTRRRHIQRERVQEITIDGEVLTHNRQERVVGEELLFDMKHAKGVPAHAASEGTLIALGILTVLLSEERPTLLLIDDLEHGLHPAALGDLVKQLRMLLERHEDLQILATTHSPYLVDHFQPEEVLITVLDEEGNTRCARIDEHPDFERWREDMSPGEFWSFAAEDWVRQER